MKLSFYAFAMCQSMFCAIPFPGNLWEEKARGRMLLFLPLVGLEIGAIWALAAWICRILALPTLVTGLVLALCPYILTGGIHLDGFMDVTDAVRSWRDAARRREILKDSHVGSFAVVGLAMLLLSQFALLASAKEAAPVGVLALIPAVSRCGSALAVTGLPPMSTSQYAAQKKPKSHLWLLSAMAAVLVAAGFFWFGKYGFALIGCLCGYGLALRRAYKSLEGMNGDVAGYALTLGELCGVAVYALL